jgi:hypothetical protein
MRGRFSYANVAATLALVLSMSGGALAAKHYLITSTRQIKPSVLKRLKGNNGPVGREGPQGREGASGKEGPQGKEGLQGPSKGFEGSKLGEEGGGELPETEAPVGSLAVPQAAIW